MLFGIKIDRDTFGRVKVVDGTGIVTVFTTVNLIPLYPHRSLYMKPRDPRRGGSESVPVRDDGRAPQLLPLASVDRTSAAVAYLRALFGLLAISGVLLLVPAIQSLMGEPLDELATMLTRGLAASSAVGVVGGASTYIVPLVSDRERRIRRHCGEGLGLAVDPARLGCDRAEEVADMLPGQPDPDDSRRRRLIRDLIGTRARIARSGGAFELEAGTDRLLEELEFLDCRGE